MYNYKEMLRFSRLRKKITLLIWPSAENEFIPLWLKGHVGFFLVLVSSFLFLLFTLSSDYFYTSPFFSKVASKELFELLLQERRKRGIEELRWNPRLEKAAILKAQDMLSKDYFAHTSPDGVPGWYFLKLVGYRYKIAGENLAIGFLDSYSLHLSWKNSPSHYKNMLEPRFKEVGIGVLSGDFKGSRATVVVEFLASPLEEKEKTGSTGTGESGAKKESKDMTFLQDNQNTKENPSFSGVVLGDSAIEKNRVSDTEWLLFLSIKKLQIFLQKTLQVLSLGLMLLSLFSLFVALFRSGYSLWLVERYVLSILPFVSLFFISQLIRGI